MTTKFTKIKKKDRFESSINDSPINEPKEYKGSILLFSIHPTYRYFIFVFSEMNQELGWVKRKQYNKIVVSDLGGRKDKKKDKDILYTAAREFFEESMNFNITNKKNQTVLDIYAFLKQEKYFARIDNIYNNRKYTTFLVEIPFDAKVSCTFLTKRNKLLKVIKKKNKKRSEKQFLNNHDFVTIRKDLKYYLKDAFNETQDLIYISLYDLITIIKDQHDQYMCLRTQKKRVNDILPIFIELQNELDLVSMNTKLCNSRSF